MLNGHKFVSIVWLEYFHVSDRITQIEGVRLALSTKRNLGPQSKLAVFNVDDAIDQCACAGIEIEIRSTNEEHDPSHAGIYGEVEDHNDIAAILANRVTHAVYDAVSS